MKKKFLSMAFFCCLTCSYAQEYGRNMTRLHSQESSRDYEYSYAPEPYQEWRKEYVNLCFSNASMQPNDYIESKRNISIGITVGHTFFLTKPINNLFRLGVDATWLDVNYTNYNLKCDEVWPGSKIYYHQGEISVRLGPSITFEPIRKLAIHAYFQYAPTYALLYENDYVGNVYSSYASLWFVGTNVSYGVIGIGIEGRLGNTVYVLSGTNTKREKQSLSCFRFYLTVKF